MSTGACGICAFQSPQGRALAPGPRQREQPYHLEMTPWLPCTARRNVGAGGLGLSPSSTNC